MMAVKVWIRPNRPAYKDEEKGFFAEKVYDKAVL